jgi:hypothetical protein
MTTHLSEQLSSRESKNRLDPSREAVAGYTGLLGPMMLTNLLSHSTLEDETSANGSEKAIVAVLRPKNLRTLAKELCYGYDTFTRYIAVFRALGLVEHLHKAGRKVELRIRLDAYTPLGNFLVLDELINKGRARLRALAQKARNHYISAFGDPCEFTTPRHRLAWERITESLNEARLPRIQREHIITILANLVAEIEQQASKQRDIHECSTPPERSHNDNQNTLHHDKQPGEPVDAAPPEEQKRKRGRPRKAAPATTPVIGDKDTSEQKDTNDEEQSTQEKGSTDENRVLPLPSKHHSAEQPDTENTSAGDTKGNNTKKPFLFPVRITYSANTLIDTINKNVKRIEVAQFLASVLENSEYEQNCPTYSKYLTLFKKHSPETIGKAFVATMVLLYQKGWTMKNKGALLTKLCKILDGKITDAKYSLPDIERWFADWRHLDYIELVKTLTAHDALNKNEGDQRRNGPPRPTESPRNRFTDMEEYNKYPKSKWNMALPPITADSPPYAPVPPPPFKSKVKFEVREGETRAEAIMRTYNEVKRKLAEEERNEKKKSSPGFVKDEYKEVIMRIRTTGPGAESQSPPDKHPENTEEQRGNEKPEEKHTTS